MKTHRYSLFYLRGPDIESRIEKCMFKSIDTTTRYIQLDIIDAKIHIKKFPVVQFEKLSKLISSLTKISDEMEENEI